MAKKKYEAKDIRKPLIFKVRKGTSDEKSIAEVVTRRGYGRYNFTPRPGEQWIDLGANIGAFAVWAAAHGANVAAYEPEPGCYERLVINAGLNGKTIQDRITPIQSGVAADARKKKMHMSVNSARGNVWRSSMFKDWQGGESIDVPVTTVEGLWTPDNCIKMDIEGMEMPILERFADKPVKRLVFEWSFDIDPSLDRFRQVIKTLQETYPNVKGGNVPDDAPEDKWQPQWFPPCRLVYCWS